MTELSPFLTELGSFIRAHALPIIRVSQAYRNESIETLECMHISPCQDVYSVAKTFTMTAVGLLFDQGKLRLDEKVCDILSDDLPESGMDRRWTDATVEMALTHRLGLPGGFLDIDVQSSADFTDDFLSYLLTFPLSYAPGSEARYSDGAYYLLARIVEKRAGMTLENFLWQKMLAKLGFQELAWSHCPRGHAIGATGLYIHSADMAKLGLLYLNGGLYRGRRILSETWTKMAVAKEYALNWHGHKTAYGKGGMYGQELLIVPAQQRVVAVQAFGDVLEKINDFILSYGDRS